MKVENIGSNQTQVELNNGTIVLVSYKQPVACCIPGKGFFKTATKWSVTTSRHINKWLNGAKAATMPQEFFDKLGN